MHPHPKSSYQNENRATGRDPCHSSPPLPVRFFAEFSRLLKAWAAGAEMIEPAANLSKRQLMTSNASENRRGRAPYALWIGKFL